MGVEDAEMRSWRRSSKTNRTSKDCKCSRTVGGKEERLENTQAPKAVAEVPVTKPKKKGWRRTLVMEEETLS